MALRSDNYYRELAAQAVRDAHIEEPPVPPTAIAANLGVPIVELPLPSWFTAALIYEDGMPAILLNAIKEEVTQRAGIAHLLGHLLIVLDDQDAVYPKDGLTYHRDADFLSEELEIPSFMVIDQAQKWFNDHRYLARLFGVSEKRMLDKMHALGILKNRGLVWDY